MGRRGFSIVEVLVVILIISSLAAALYAGFVRAREAATFQRACQFGGVVHLGLANRARETLESLGNVLSGLGLATAPAPTGESGTWYNCAVQTFGTPPPRTVCRAGVKGGGFAVYTWPEGATRRCLNGAPAP